MKKKCIMALIIGAAFLAQGCGYEEGTDAVVTVVDSTPTPEPQRSLRQLQHLHRKQRQQIPQQTEPQRQRIPRQTEQRQQTPPQPEQQIPQHRQQLQSRPQAVSTYRLRMPPTMQWRV